MNNVVDSVSYYPSGTYRGLLSGYIFSFEYEFEEHLVTVEKPVPGWNVPAIMYVSDKTANVEILK